MDVTQYVTALREDLVSAAAAGDEQTQRTATLLAAAIEPAARLAVMNALADLAEEVTEALEGERTVELRLNGRQVKVVVTEPPSAQPSNEPPTSTPPIADAGDISRITLRLMEEIKGHAEQAANRQGVSLNSWIAQAVQGALYGAQSRNQSRGRADWGPDAQRGRERGPRKNRDDGRSVRGWVQG